MRQAGARPGAAPRPYWLGGRRPVAAALAAGRALRLAYAEGARGLEALRARAEALGLPVERVPRSALTAYAGEEAQGVAALVRPLRPVSLEDLLAPGPPGERVLLVALDHLQDPRNLGAVARTAEAAGARGLFFPERRAVGVTPAAERTAAGAFESLAWAVVHNLAQALARCRRAGFWVFGAAPDGRALGAGVGWAPRSVLVVGAEGRGLAPWVRRQCDEVVGLPMRGRVESLNAAVAAGILVYDWLRWDEAQRTRGAD